MLLEVVLASGHAESGVRGRARRNDRGLGVTLIVWARACADHAVCARRLLECLVGGLHVVRGIGAAEVLASFHHIQSMLRLVLHVRRLLRRRILQDQLLIHHAAEVAASTILRLLRGLLQRGPLHLHRLL